jgi:hypothetical protein
MAIEGSALDSDRAPLLCTMGAAAAQETLYELALVRSAECRPPERIGERKERRIDCPVGKLEVS